MRVNEEGFKARVSINSTSYKGSDHIENYKGTDKYISFH